MQNSPSFQEKIFFRFKLCRLPPFQTFSINNTFVVQCSMKERSRKTAPVKLASQENFPLNNNNADQNLKKKKCLFLKTKNILVF